MLKLSILKNQLIEAKCEEPRQEGITARILCREVSSQIRRVQLKRDGTR